MRTSNIRCAVLVAAAALSLNVSAQKNVLKAFEKFKTSKGVTVTNSTRESASDLQWRCNVTEFRVFKGAGITFKMKALQQAFEKDSRGKNATYFTQMKGLDESATEEEKARYKKMTVRYNTTDAPVVIGANTDYDVLLLRCRSNPGDFRIVVAMEWRLDEQNNCVGTFYEIEGQNSLVSTSTISAADYEKGGDNIMARMNFYRSNYTGEETTESNALLLNMLEYLSTVATHATEEEKNVARTTMLVMGEETSVEMQKGILLQCIQALNGLPTSAPNTEAAQNEVVARIRSYRQEYCNERVYSDKDEILKRLKEYLSKQTLDATTFPLVRDEILSWRESMTIYDHRERLARALGELERRYDDANKQ